MGVSRDGGTSWQVAGVSKNPLYVCLSSTGPNTATLYRTVVHLACSNAGATSQSEAAANTWDNFSTGSGPKNVKTWGESTKLYYYEPGKTFDENPHIDCADPPGTNPLLSAHRGQCSTWATLLQDAWSVNGVNSDYIFAVRTVGDAFFVQEWDALSTTRPFWFQTTISDMIPAPPGVAPDPSPFAITMIRNRLNFLNKRV